MQTRILMIRLSAIGDVVNTLPALSLLRRALPEAHIGFVVEDRARDLIVGHPQIDQVYVFPRRRWRAMLLSLDPRRWAKLARETTAYVAAIRRGRYEVVLDEQGNLKGALHSWLSGAPRRIGFARGADRELNHWFSNERVRPPEDRPHRVDKFASLLLPLGIDSPERDYVLPSSEASRPRVAAYLAEHGLAAGGFVVLHPGTSERGATKRWSCERFAELARRVRCELGRTAVVTWGPGEEALAASICAGSDGAAIPGPATDSLLELAELIGHAAVFVSADTGPMHVAAACRIPCVALFGPKDPAVYRPFGEGHTVIYRPDTNGTPGMQLITVDEVFEAVATRLAAR